MSQTVGDETVAYLSDRTMHLWVLAVVFFGVGDLITTTVGLQFDQIVEVGPLAAYAVNHGYATLGALKAATMLLAVGLWRATPSPYRVGVPLGLATLGVLVTLWNLLMLALAIW